MAKFIKRPEVIEAIQYTGFERLNEIREFMKEDFDAVLFRPHSETLILDNNLNKSVGVGDYIIRDFMERYKIARKDEFESSFKEVRE